MELIDSHAHIYLPEFDEDRFALIEEASNNGVSQILMPAIDHDTHEALLDVEQHFPSCIAMMGLHPCSVKDSYKEELLLTEKWFAKRKFIAVGEIGLDFHWDKSFTDQQYKAFHHQIALALKYDVPIVVHSRNATQECIEVVRQYPTLQGVFHCFSGTLVEAEQVIDCGFMLGIGGVLTFKNAGLDKVVAEIGIEHVVLETDAPYLTPVPFRGKRNQVGYLSYIAQKVALVTDISVEEVAAITTANAKSLFGLQ